MHYTVNGDPHEAEAISIAELVAGLTSATQGVAVALNGDVVPRSAWDRALTDGDVVDVLTAVQGG